MNDIVDRLSAELAAIQPGMPVRTEQIKGALADAIYEINLLRAKLETLEEFARSVADGASFWYEVWEQEPLT